MGATTTASGEPAAWSPASRVVATAGLFAAACVAVGAVALLNGAWFDALNGVVGATETVARGLLFSSWLLLVGGVVVVWRPAAFGFRVGAIRDHLALIGLACAGAVLATTAIIRLVGSVPYSDASLFIEAVDVPFTEELAFRAVLLTALLAAMALIWRDRPLLAVALAVLIDGVAFGVGHLANATAWASAFVVGQTVFAAVLGTLCAALMVRTRSVYPAMLLHGVVNAAVVLAS